MSLESSNYILPQTFEIVICLKVVVFDVCDPCTVTFPFGVWAEKLTKHNTMCILLGGSQDVARVKPSRMCMISDGLIG